MSRLYRIDEVATQLQLGRATTYRLIARGLLPSVKIGRSRRVAEEDLRAFIELLRAEHSQPARNEPSL